MPNQSTTLFNGRWLSLKQRDGWEYAARNNPQGAAIIIAVTPSGEVLFVEQYRVPIQAQTLEFPAGLIGDDGNDAEAIEAAARRELLEETGYHAGWMRPIMGGPSSAGMSTEIMHFWRAGALDRRHDGGGVGSEQIVVHSVPIAEAAGFVHARMMDGFQIDPKVYAGLYFLTRDATGLDLDQAWYR